MKNIGFVPLLGLPVSLKATTVSTSRASSRDSMGLYVCVSLYVYVYMCVCTHMGVCVHSITHVHIPSCSTQKQMQALHSALLLSLNGVSWR